MAFRFSGAMYRSVRRLWRRSANLMRITRGSEAMETSILRYVSAWRCSRVCEGRSAIFVTPSTRKATSSPKSFPISATGISVSSTTSWSTPAITVASSMPFSARMRQTSKGWSA